MAKNKKSVRELLDERISINADFNSLSEANSSEIESLVNRALMYKGVPHRLKVLSIHSYAHSPMGVYLEANLDATNKCGSVPRWETRLAGEFFERVMRDNFGLSPEVYHRRYRTWGLFFRAFVKL